MTTLPLQHEHSVMPLHKLLSSKGEPLGKQAEGCLHDYKHHDRAATLDQLVSGRACTAVLHSSPTAHVKLYAVQASTEPFQISLPMHVSQDNKVGRESHRRAEGECMLPNRKAIPHAAPYARHIINIVPLLHAPNCATDMSTMGVHITQHHISPVLSTCQAFEKISSTPYPSSALCC